MKNCIIFYCNELQQLCLTQVNRVVTITILEYIVQYRVINLVAFLTILTSCSDDVKIVIIGFFQDNYNLSTGFSSIVSDCLDDVIKKKP